jgi:two-component system sensor histidine kinase VicK
LKIIESNSDRLRKLINNILHSSTYDKDTIELDYNMVDISAILNRIIVNLSLTAREKKIKIAHRSVPDKIMCEIDSDKMEEVFQNLISNAIKFSKDGSTIKMALKLTNVSIIEFAIQDQGIGIPHKEVPYVFEKMYRASNSKNISVKGTGLGLYITSHIIRAHGGKITVKSTLGKGTIFNIRLPRNKKIATEGGWFDA